MLISISQIIDTELVLLGPAQRSQASLVSILLGRTSKNLNKCSESLTHRGFIELIIGLTDHYDYQW